MAVEHLCWGASCEVRGIPELEQSPVEGFTVDIAGGGSFHDQVFYGLDRRLSMTVGLGVMWRRHHMVHAPTLHELPEVRAGELGPTICAEAEGNTNFSEVPAEHPYGVGGCGITTTRDDNRPSRESVRNN